MDYNIQDVPLSQIRLDDDTFKVSTGSLSPALKVSIERTGLINPPILLTKNKQYIIVSGFARIQACRDLNWNCIPARCLAPDTSAHDCIHIAIADNAIQRPLNIVEQSRAIVMLRSLAEQKEHIVSAAQQAGFSVNQKMVAKLLKVGQMSQRLQQGIVDSSIALPVALQLEHTETPDTIDELGALLQELNLSLNRQRELIDWIKAIAQREQISITAVLTDDQLQTWRRQDNTDRRHKANLIRNHLRKRRFPEISAFEKRYSDALKGIKLPEGVQLIAPQHFEGDTFVFRVDFKDHRELEQTGLKIQRLIETGLIQNIVDQAKVP